MQRDFNNSTGNTSEIYNTISLLPTKTDVATSITNNNLNYTTSLLTTTLINNNIIANNLLYTNTTNLNVLLANAVTSRDTAIATAISNEVLRANNSIVTNNTALLSTIKTYTVDQNFSNINLSGKLNFTVLNDGATTVFGYNSYAGPQSIAIGVNANNINQMNSVAIGFTSKNLSGGSVSIGSYATSYANCIAIGYNSANQSNSQNTNNTYLGYNANIPLNTSYSNSCAIGYNSIINASNSVFLGREGIDTTVCYALNTTNLTATNITTSNLISNGILTYNYSVLPLLTSYKVNGFSSSINNVKNIVAFDSVLNCSAITLPCGVYYINYQYTINYSTGPINYWLNYGLGSTSSIIDIQANKSYCSSNSSNVYNCANSFCFTSTNGSILYQNVMLNSFDNPTLTVSNLANFTFVSKITATRVA